MAEWFCFLNQTLPQQLATTSMMRDRGCVPVSLSVHAERRGRTVQPRYTSVWHERPGEEVDHRFLALAKFDEVRPWREEREAEGMFPRLVSAYGSDTRDRRYSVIATPGPETWLEIELQAAIVKTLAWTRFRTGWYPASAALFGEVGATGALSEAMAVVWQKQPPDSFVYWNLKLDAERDFGKAASARRAGFAWPHLLSLMENRRSTDRKRLSIWRDDEIEGMTAETSIPVGRLGQRIDEITSAGKWLLSLQGTAYGPEQRFDLVAANAGHWRERRRRLTVRRAMRPPIDEPRDVGSGSLPIGTPVHTGDGGSFPKGTSVHTGGGSGAPRDRVPLPFNAFQPVEDYVIRLMRRHSIRAGQLAIARNGRLAHAAAFTWADPDYPVAEVTTRMRLASIAKVLTATGVVRLSETPGHTFDLFDETKDSIGNLLNISHDGWDTRSVAHVLCHVAWFRVEPLGAAWESLTIVNKLGIRLPVGRDDCLAFLRTWQPSDGKGFFDSRTPPDFDTALTTHPDYSNFGYERAADIIAAVTGETVEDWTRREIFAPLGLSRPCIGYNRAAEAAGNTDELRYHPARPDDAWDQFTGDGPTGNMEFTELAAHQYEGTNLDLGIGGGAWSWAAVDCARLLSSFGGPDSPVSSSAEDLLLHQEFAENRTLGFFVTSVDTPNGGRQRVLLHNGFASGMATLALRRDDSTVAVLAFNTDLYTEQTGQPTLRVGLHFFPHGATVFHLLDAIAEESWPDHDLFPAVAG
jgi:CubicO group peptidase (beta-lactamase class C family)